MADSPTHLDRPICAGIFPTMDAADQAVEKLVSAGFTKDHITAVCSDKAVRRHFDDINSEQPAGGHTDEALSAAGAIGLTLGGFVALTGLVTTAGTALMVAGAFVGLAAVGTFTSVMSTRGLETELADYYDQAVSDDKILIAVESDDPEEIRKAEEVITAAGSEPLRLPRG